MFSCPQAHLFTVSAALRSDSAFLALKLATSATKAMDSQTWRRLHQERSARLRVIHALLHGEQRAPRPGRRGVRGVGRETQGAELVLPEDVVLLRRDRQGQVAVVPHPQRQALMHIDKIYLCLLQISWKDNMSL